MSSQIYRHHQVVRRLANGELIVYQCLELLLHGGFVVQSADRLRPPFSTEQFNAHQHQFYELISQEAPELRSPAAQSLQDAVAAFDREFGDEW